ncbi:hypothetical protein PV10_02971 [Exophiala mesophila]|uniref:Multifunctional methyltransferase subunit TRM112 n=1 Tax=Exophiala mesophila TaxID=212818 RepID=A0A0D1X0K0_EXOME|nr:uncharacterized protein PV10_02971 [Exophiala mesophila]KIV95300.1 hypothetical protein PV10_02971 [Exophiala mesophila]
MKLLTTNFLTCAVKTCKTSPESYPLHFRDASLQKTEIEFNPLFMRNILPRVNWEALKTTAQELGLSKLVPDKNPIDVNDSAAEIEVERNRQNEQEEEEDEDEVMDLEGGQESSDPTTTATSEADNVVGEEVLKNLHGLLLETGVTEGKLVCGNCGFEYPIKDGVGNFLLPAHLV